MKSMKYFKLFLSGSLIFLVLTTVAVTAFLAGKNNSSDQFEVGAVKVEIEAFYSKNGTIIPIDINQVGGGVVELNISNPDNIEHFNNFRVNVKVYSSVLTYFRVNVVEQFTLTYTTGDQTTVIAVVKENFSKFAYNTTDFFDNRLADGFFYYKHKVKRVNETTPTTIEFIEQLPLENYHPIYESKYSIRVGFLVDAVQYIDGPKINWGLDNPPWSSNEEW